MKVRRPAKELIAGVQTREDGGNWPDLKFLLRAELTGLTCGLDMGTGCRGRGKGAVVRKESTITLWLKTQHSES